MRSLASLLALCLLVSPSLNSLGEELRIAEKFAHYTPGPLEDGWAAPTAEEKTLPAWHVGDNGVGQEILLAPESDHSGPLFAYRETEDRSYKTYSFTQLAEPCKGDASWDIAIEFYIDSLENPGVFGLVGLYDQNIHPHDNLATVAFSRNSVNGKVQTSVQTGKGSLFFKGYLEEKQWYRLLIHHPPGTQTLDFKLEGSGYSQAIAEQSFQKETAQFDILALGDTIPNQWHAERNNRVFIRSLQLHTGP